MWVRLRLDIGWRHLCCGFFGSLVPGGRQAARKKLETFWCEGRSDALASLSVRSGFDLLLQALDLPEGSEVLFSAVTLADMPRIAEAHGLVPVPVDVCDSDYHIDITSLRQAVTPKSRLLVVAHLFGARPNMQEVLEVARELKLFVVEDCAQAFSDPRWRGNEEADVSLFSFGAIKTATALGGSLCRVKAPDLLARMADIQSQQPVQAAGNLPLKFCKFAFFKAISTKLAFGWIATLGRRFGKSVDDILGGLTRGFSSDGLLHQLRHQPKAGLLRMMRHRLRTYDSRRVNRRITNARRIITKLGLEKSHPKLLDSRHTFWLFPFLTDRAEELIPYLRRHGYDSTQRGSMEIVPPPPNHSELGCSMATERLSQTVFLPCYPELTDDAIDGMCALILAFTADLSQQRQQAAAAIDP
jgi:dTDP-4-amino-4,6-dideoxygalactose transaminase